jgi:hypothetical protein
MFMVSSTPYVVRSCLSLPIAMSHWMAFHYTRYERPVSRDHPNFKLPNFLHFVGDPEILYSNLRKILNSY